METIVNKIRLNNRQEKKKVKKESVPILYNSAQKPFGKAYY